MEAYVYLFVHAFIIAFFFFVAVVQEKKSELSETPSIQQIKHELLFASFLFPFRNVKSRFRKKKQEIVNYFCLGSISGVLHKYTYVYLTHFFSSSSSFVYAYNFFKSQNALKVIMFHQIADLFLQSLCCKEENQKQIEFGSPKHNALVGNALLIGKEEWKYGIMLAESVLREKNENTDTIKELQKWISKSSLNDCWKWKKLYNGTELQRDFPIFAEIKNQKFMSQVFNALSQQHLSFPSMNSTNAKHFIAGWIEQNIPTKTQHTGSSK
ncbi:hypothetical protein RFI_04397 [Reticulomyxa filosa]|uniref:Uncharacterized protein n=1 Tax=Reticulomyxa filosa TaxID=46433 RepID=X6P2D6_RETFI|nr:hypothetical protein RFI_04397 [Reticulomyxa filosa]|eukprot:ETO32720.1 hypothetical protein RFI_04397 [Reticulomyxa filosa]